MGWRRLQGLVVPALLILLLGSTGTSAGERPRAVLELFTSQGCSSCPPADRHLAEIADRTDLIALTFHVDYWDYLGWKDTLADPSHAKRQKGYAAARGDRQVYTPQMVINGLTHAIGSDRTAVENAIVASLAQSGVLSITIDVKVSGDRMVVQLPDLPGGPVSALAPANVLLLGVASEVPVTIARGENRGNTVIYRNVVRSHTLLGEWNGTAQSFSLSRADRIASGCERAVVIVQSGSNRRPGAVIGATMARLQ